MLKLIEGKERELIDKYGFQLVSTVNGDTYCFEYGKALRIYPVSNQKHPGQVRADGFSKKTQDKIFDLISDKILEKVSNENNTKMQMLQKKLAIIQNKIKELEKEEKR